MPFLLRVELPDVPGSLGRLAGAIGEAGGDIEAIEIVEKRHDGTAVDDVLLELPPTAMPDTIVSACNQLPGVHVVWISRYAAGGNLFLDLEAVEDLTANPTEALDRLVDLLPVTFRADWAARVHRADGQRYSTEAAPSDLPFLELVRTERVEIEGDDVNVMVAARLGGNEIVVLGRRGGPDFLDSELARVGHLAGLAMSIQRD
ncbi:MAG: amino acid-binding protein [Nocardioides sp.]|nr:amino acid-binding protein [Nocardioides sp.]